MAHAKSVCSRLQLSKHLTQVFMIILLAFIFPLSLFASQNLQKLKAVTHISELWPQAPLALTQELAPTSRILFLNFLAKFSTQILSTPLSEMDFHDVLKLSLVNSSVRRWTRAPGNMEKLFRKSFENSSKTNSTKFLSIRDGRTHNKRDSWTA
jgi:hypothetical protein